MVRASIWPHLICNLRSSFGKWYTSSRYLITDLISLIPSAIVKKVKYKFEVGAF